MAVKPFSTLSPAPPPVTKAGEAAPMTKKNNDDDKDGAPEGDPQSHEEAPDFSSVENAHNSPNTHEFLRRREWAGAYVGLEGVKDTKRGK